MRAVCGGVDEIRESGIRVVQLHVCGGHYLSAVVMCPAGFSVGSVCLEPRLKSTSMSILVDAEAPSGAWFGG